MLSRVLRKYIKRQNGILLPFIENFQLRSYETKSNPDDKPEVDERHSRSSFLRRIKSELDSDKQELKWRTEITNRSDQWESKLKLFENSEQTSDHIIMMQKPIDLSVEGIKRWFQNRKEVEERHLQKFIPERHEILGPDLAAAHFILYRQGAIKFVNQKTWMRSNEDNEFNLPTKFDANYQLEALRCDNMNLYYEGLENLRCLNHLKFLSFHNVVHFDDWCLDRVSGSQYPKLEVLDISKTSCTYMGLSCLYRIPSLKLLIIDDPEASLELKLSCAMLEEAIPNLKIVNERAIRD